MQYLMGKFCNISSYIRKIHDYSWNKTIWTNYQKMLSIPRGPTVAFWSDLQFLNPKKSGGSQAPPPRNRAEIKGIVLQCMIIAKFF